METKRSFEILELDQNASLEEAKQAYRDQVKFFHPDRFAHDPRQKEKAEKKLKEVNEAYEQVKVALASKEKGEHAAAKEDTVRKYGEPSTKPAYHEAQQRSETKNKEKAGTGSEILRGVGSFLSGALRRIFETQVAKEEGRPGMQQQGQARGKGKGRGIGRSKGSGRGRGKGRGGR